MRVLLLALLLAAVGLGGAIIGYRLKPAPSPSPAGETPAAPAADPDPLAAIARGALEHTMVHGDPLTAPQLMKRLRRQAPKADLAIYDPRGVEAFGPLPRAPHPRAMAPQLVAALTDRQRHDAPDGTVYRPLLGGDDCNSCHDDHAEVRGVLTLETATACDGKLGRAAITRLVDDTRTQLQRAKADELLAAFDKALTPPDDDEACPQLPLEQTIQTAFVYLMRAHQGRRAYQLLDSAVDSGALAQGALFDAAGRKIYDTKRDPVPDRVHRALAGETVTDRGDGDRPRIIEPLPGGAECAGCHGDDKVLGAISATVP